MEFKAYIMDSAAVNRALARISHEIIERNGDSDEICLVGIMRRGAPLADILASKIESLGVKTQKGYLDITLYRDDLSESASQPTVNSGKLDFPLRARRSSWSTMCSTPAERRARDGCDNLPRPPGEDTVCNAC